MVKGSVRVILDKPYYLSGELVTGRVDLIAHEHIHGAHSLMIRWKGFERTLIENTITVNDNGEQRTEQQKFKDEREFFKQVTVVNAYHGGVVNAGPSSFPFSFQLPQKIPGVFFYEGKEFDGDKIRAAIVYKAKCWLDMPGKDIKHCEKFVVAEAVAQAVLPVHEENKKSFLFAKGNLKMTADLPKNVYVPGEVVPVKVSVNNESSKKVEHLKVKLMRTVIIRAQGMKKEQKSELHRQVFEGVDKKSTKDVVLNYTIDPNVYPSADGQLIDCKYHLDVECDVARAIDLEVHPKILIALLPAAGQPVSLYNNYARGGW